MASDNNNNDDNAANNNTNDNSNPPEPTTAAGSESAQDSAAAAPAAHSEEAGESPAPIREDTTSATPAEDEPSSTPTQQQVPEEDADAPEHQSQTPITDPSTAPEPHTTTSDTTAPTPAETQPVTATEDTSQPATQPSTQPADPAPNKEIGEPSESRIQEATDRRNSAPLQQQESEDAGPSLALTLLLTSGSRHPFRIDAKYLRKREVNVPDYDPYSMSVYTLKELILREWRSGMATLPDPEGVEEVDGGCISTKYWMVANLFLPCPYELI